MSFFKSSEIRWFFSGEIPNEVENWFIGITKNLNHDLIDDNYLKFSGSSNVGVKYRNGNLEIKPLIKDLGEFIINEKATGKIEIWEKWSEPVEASTFKFGPEWIWVRKERKLKKFIIKADEIHEAKRGMEISVGCNLELTRINYKDNKLSWSLAFEAFEKKGTGLDILKKVVKKVMNEKNNPLHFLQDNGMTGSYSLKNSFSYPGFLLSL